MHATGIQFGIAIQREGQPGYSSFTEYYDWELQLLRNPLGVTIEPGDEVQVGVICTKNEKTAHIVHTHITTCVSHEWCVWVCNVRLPGSILTLGSLPPSGGPCCL